MAGLFKALSNPHRLALFARMAACCAPDTACCGEDEEALCVGDVGAPLDIAPSTVSHHLKELRQAGLIRMERRGQSIFCWAEPEAVREVLAFINQVAPQRTQDEEQTEMSTNDEVRKAVREHYAEVATRQTGCCGGPATGCESTRLGYDAEELAAVPEGADLGLGCGNPQAIAALQPGETVLDLGAGGGLDCFLAAKQVGPEGRVIGVDMTAEMIGRARANAAKGGYENVEFRLGEIEHLPVADGTVDVILSNCVVNLSPDKRQVYADAFRVLRSGGRIAISDVVLLQPLPADVAADLGALSACVAGAATVADLEKILADAGFGDIAVRVKPESRAFVADWMPGRGIEDCVASATIEARKP